MDPVRAFHKRLLRGGFLNYTQRAQCNELVHDKCRPTMYGMLLWKMRPRRKRRHRFWTRDTFSYMRDERGEFKLFNEMYKHDHESFHHNFQSCQVWLYCSARLDRQRRQREAIADRCTSCHYQVKRRHVIGQIKPCVACVKLEHWFNSWVALRALRIVKETAHYSHASLYTLTHWDDRNENAIMR